MTSDSAKTVLWVLATLLSSGCCGGQLCSTRFYEPIDHLGQTPGEIPYSEPPCGFQTVGGHPSMGPQGDPPPMAVNAPSPKFLPVPTRPVFTPAELISYPPATPEPAPAKVEPEGDRIWSRNQMFPDTVPPGFGGTADPPPPPVESDLPSPMKNGPEALPPTEPSPMKRIPSPMKQIPSPDAAPAKQPDDSKIATRPASARMFEPYRSQLKLVE